MSLRTVFAGPFFSALAWALVHFLWQGAVVAALLAAAALALKKRSPAVRYAVSCGALATMLALPIATGWSIARSERFAVAPADATSSSPLAASPRSIDSAFDSGDPVAAAPWRARLDAARPWLLTAWFTGVLFLSIRFLGGLSAARQLTRKGARPAPPEWQHTVARIAERLSMTRPVRLLESAVVQVPTAIGALRPAILLPASVLTGLPVRGLEALIAHELAHVRRHDYLVNLLQTVVETLLFYHPAVWWVSERVRSEREQCCDDVAVGATGDARAYARALVRLEEMRADAPALAVAAVGGNLWSRVVRVLKESRGPSEGPSGWVAGALALVMLLTIGAAARVAPPAAVALPESETPLLEATADVVVSAEPYQVASLDPDAPTDAEQPADLQSGEPEPTPSEDSEEPDTDSSEPLGGEEGKTRALTPDELVAFRVHGVTAEFIRALSALGYSRADPDDIVALKVHGVTPESISEMNRIFGRRSLEEHVAFRIHGVDAETVRRLSALGLGKIGPDQALALRIHGVDTRYVEGLRAAGFERLSADEVVAAKIHGVDPADAAAWGRRAGFERPSLEELTAARIHGVTADFAARIRELGFKDVSLEELTAFRIHGVTPEFIREMRAQGLAHLDDEDVVAFRVHGVNAELVRGIRSLGYTDLDPDDLVGLRVHGVTPDQVRKTNSLAGRRVPLDELLENRVWETDHDHDDDDEN